MKIIIALCVLFILLFGCVGPFAQKPAEETPTGEANETIPEPEKLPSFVIVSPKNGETFKIKGNTTSVTLILSTANLLLKQPGGEIKIGEGHFHITLNAQKPIELTAKKYTIENVGIGEHSLKIEIVKNDHSSYSPKIIKTIYFTVEKDVQLEPQTIDVTINDFSYAPSEIKIKVGDSVKWTNKSKFPRSVTAANQSFNSFLASGETFIFKFKNVGSYEYSSANWPDMKGKIVVE